jgi:hypothetical protein
MRVKAPFRFIQRENSPRFECVLLTLRGKRYIATALMFRMNEVGYWLGRPKRWHRIAVRWRVVWAGSQDVTTEWLSDRNTR